jgi:hypothetical protein
MVAIPASRGARRPAIALTRIIYTSRAFGFDSATLAGILLDARRCNRRDGITGSLICRADMYLQLLEGPDDLVEACFGRISRDDRHLDIRLIDRAVVEERLFPEWDMRDDPARSWMWTADEVAAGAAERATPAEVLAIFQRLALEGDAPERSGCPGAA